MKLLYPLTTYPPSVGGAQLHQHLIAQHISKDGHAVQVVAFWDQNRTDWLLGTTIKVESLSRQYQIDGIPVHILGFSRAEKWKMLPWILLYYPFMPWSVEQLSKILLPKVAALAGQADLIHNVRIGREVLSYAALNLARKRGIPFVLTPVHHPRWTGWRYRVFTQIYRDADAVIALTEAERQILVDLGVQPERVHVTGHGPILSDVAHPEAFRKSHDIQGSCVLFLGQHFHYKGYQTLVKAAPLVWHYFPETIFLFVGPPVKGSEEFFSEHRDPRLIRLGAVSLDAKSNALAACDMLCVPSTQESFGGVYTEAWMFQKPVIGCPIPAVMDVVSHEVDGLLVDQHPSAIADAIIRLLRDPAFAQRLGASGYQKVMDNYSWPRLAEKTMAVYRQVLSNG